MHVLRPCLAGLAALFALAGSAPAAAEAAARATTTAAAPTPSSGPRPAIWLLADADTRIYLFGTVHILPPGLRWRSAELDRIVAESDELVLEIGEDPDSVSADELFGPMLSGKSIPVLSRVSPERRAPLRKLIEASGLPITAYDNMHTWAVALMLEVTAIAQAYARDDVDPSQLTGVEDELRAAFVAAERPIGGVESSAQQLAFFSTMPMHSQRAMLDSLIDGYAGGDAVFDPEEQGWVSGDVEAIAAEMAELPPDLFEVLITRRNNAWTGWLIDRLDRPGTVLFAVGAGHLAGRDSVQSMLAARGFEVTRINAAR